MEKITREQVKKISELAHLSLTDAEIDKLKEDMEKMLDYFKMIDSVDLSEIEETIYVQDLKNILRKDEVKEFSEQKMIVDNFPEEDGNFLIVPQKKN
jgi:aspartyl-tRNA(Asn)/glutamyl-tRNA(Gln) amidotransferase subunit C